MYDFVIVGAGLFGAVFAHQATRKGRTCLVVDKRDHVGGNCYTQPRQGIVVHVYGPHIFHTSSRRVWDFVSSLSPFNGFIHRVKANCGGRFYSFPINLMTLNQVLGIRTPEQAREVLRSDVSADNLQEWAIQAVGRELYELLIKGYTAKQWLADPATLPPHIIQRLAVRTTFDDRYFTDPYQGIPVGGYTPIFERLLEGSEVRLGVDYFRDRPALDRLGRLLYTGRLDEYYDFTWGPLAYRTLRFEHATHPVSDYQGNAVINHCDLDVPFTRTVEHKHFDPADQDATVVTTEYPAAWTGVEEPYYPAYGSDDNDRAARRYRALRESERRTLFGGRLASYEYLDMDKVILQALQLADRCF